LTGGPRLLAQFFRRFLRYKRDLIGGFLSLPLANLADIGITVLIGRAIDRLQRGEGSGFLLKVVGFIVLSAIAHSVFRFLQRWWIVVVSRRFECDLKSDLFRKLVALDFNFHNSSRSGDVVSRLTSDVENLRMFLGPGMMYSLSAAVVVPISIAILFWFDPTLSMFMVLPMLMMGIAMRFFSPQLHIESVKVQERIADISHRAQENFSGIRIVKGYARAEQQARLFQGVSDETRQAQILLARARGKTHAAVHGANQLTFVVILAVAGYALMDQRMTAGELFQFIDLTMKVFWPLIALGWILGMYPRAVASGERIQELLEREPLIQDGLQASDDSAGPLQGRLEARSVRFQYEGAKQPTLENINFVLPAGSTLGVVGPTGSGKTTLLHLLGRLFEVQSGQILLDDRPLNSLSLDRLRGALGYVPQDSFLFSESYRDNISFGAEQESLGLLSDEKIWAYIEQAAMREEVEAFPEKLDQLIGERGVTLSGGQRQRTCIARALAKQPRILVLDDCLSAVDTETERDLLHGLRTAGDGRTVVVAAHRLSTVREADEIIVLNEAGQIAARGTHDELIVTEGWYRDTWHRQQRVEEVGS
jgi:ATP-binding cassette subfamily B multidrug efflux pump